MKSKPIIIAVVAITAAFLLLWLISQQSKAPLLAAEQQLLEQAALDYQSQSSRVRNKVENTMITCTTMKTHEVYACMLELGDIYTSEQMDLVIKTCVVRVCALRIVPKTARMEILIEE